ncbi:SagB/ThcOx family dehydrogenase [Streptococcus equi]|uniref:Streptolysin S biosynthesis protein SagB n=1 Tax=Streptococcus equi subsp. zooepidemicus (strain MGCS10565) TaxID=552526 RepID=B4U1J6_STREM|nr:SagB family peptide dehydrogenase [Streptococcus equi]ACG61863.1 Streptolysin S biosynthesis protein SagB [Streptococcus equi subsp. zooepidemicus MGCS10565]KIS15412.1 Streptolysin S biosynthesis protein [Streptococcus equi subsp. zooepidemicus SzAM60]MCD3390454.1 SagB family peptide dehydrogenase [Streptococcus equi subsp. zooepidemicus]MDI5989759.1 SagB family peptide dehydrogenase [Streptococcus equi subsp. zooepidemicus]SQF05029.1 Streptolysin S biosynthesis protein [Streptococcus equi 
MPFFSKEKQRSDNQSDLTREEARQLFEFNTNHLSLSTYHHQTVLKTSKQLVAQHLMPDETDNLSQRFLMNYKANNNYLGFKTSVAEFFTDSAVTTFSNSDYFEDRENTIALPKAKKVSAALSTCITNRRSHRQFIDEEMPLQDLADLLYYACGVSSQAIIKEGMTKTVALRNCASGGGLYPITLFFYARNVETLKDGFYEYLPYQHALRCHHLSDQEDIRAFAEYGPITAENCNVILIYVYQYIKNTRKYGNQATAYAFIEAGEIAQNVQLVSTALVYGSVDIGGYNKEYLQEKLGLDGLTQHVIHMTIIGNKESQ